MKIRRRPTNQEIAQRAYELYQQRGHGDDQALSDWFEAEAELEAAEAEAESEDMPPGMMEGSPSGLAPQTSGLRSERAAPRSGKRRS